MEDTVEGRRVREEVLIWVVIRDIAGGEGLLAWVAHNFIHSFDDTL